LTLFKKSFPAVRVVVTAALCFFAPFVPTKQSRGDPGSPQNAKTYQRPTDPSLYVGSQVCQSCHEDTPTKDFYKNYEASPHFVTTMDTKKGPQWQGWRLVSDLTERPSPYLPCPFFAREWEPPLLQDL
jgi:hypothetical protein